MALRERALREQRYAHLNGIKIHNQWRKIMRMAKVRPIAACMCMLDRWQVTGGMAGCGSLGMQFQR